MAERMKGINPDVQVQVRQEFVLPVRARGCRCHSWDLASPLS
jgi:hypothetical protein